MDNNNFVITLLLIGCAACAIGLLRLIRQKSTGNQWLLQYPWLLKILSAVGLLFVCMGVSILVELTGGYAKILVILLSLPSAALMFLLAAEVFASETCYDESVLYRFSPWSKSIQVPFNEVVRIEKSLLKPNYVIHSKGGQVISVIKWNDGADEVLGYAQEGLESSADPLVATMLD